MSRIDRILRERGGCALGNRIARWNALLAYVIDCHNHPCLNCLCDIPVTQALIKDLEKDESILIPQDKLVQIGNSLWLD